MPKTDINTILKNGNKTKIKTIDYSSAFQQAKLKKMKEESETSLKNKEVSMYKLSKFFIKR